MMPAVTAPSGVLLPQTTLTEPWFIVLSTVVAFNTIIYVGLTLSKLIPWPRQIHPSRVRALLASLPFISHPEATVSELVTPERVESPDPYEALRRSVARQQIPQAFALLGALVLVLSVGTWLSFDGKRPLLPVIELAGGLVLLLIAVLLSRRGIRGVTMRWVWITMNVALVALLLVEATISGSLAGVAYALVVMTMFAPITLAWRPALVGGGLMLTGLVVTSLRVPSVEDGRLVAAGIGALLGGYVLLQLRLSAIDELADERTRTQALASTDPLTGALSRQGLLTLLPGVAAVAERTGQEVCVMLFDVDDLAQINREYGTHYGDTVLRSVHEAVAATVRRGDLVARWGGDEFLVAGLGDRPSADVLGRRIQEAVRAQAVDLGKRPIGVSVSTAAGLPTQVTFDALLDAAQADLPAIGR